MSICVPSLSLFPFFCPSFRINLRSWEFLEVLKCFYAFVDVSFSIINSNKFSYFYIYVVSFLLGGIEGGTACVCVCVCDICGNNIVKKRLEEVFNNTFFVVLREPINYMNSSYPCRLDSKQANIVWVKFVVVVN